MDNARLGCNQCGVCDQMFTCQCTDYLTHAITCKHIHAVQMKLNVNLTDNEGKHRCHMIFIASHLSHVIVMPTIFQALNKRQKFNQNKIRFLSLIFHPF